MAGRKSDFTLTKLDDLFSTQEQRDEEKLSKIRDIPLTEIDDFPDHPFKVRDDEDMAQLIESIKERGVITPATVRQKEDGRYELISGHRRNCDMELPSDNIIIYGHHMNDGSMFAGLMKFKDKSFWEKHKTVSFDTLTDRQTYEVIAVFKTVVYTDSPDSFKYYQFVNADTAEDFTAYVEKCKKLSLYETGITAEYGDKLLTLSTCEYSRTNGRLVVVAKLINE